MIQVSGHDIFRGGIKLGWVGSGYLYNHLGNKVACASDNIIYDESTGKKIAYISGEYVYFTDTNKESRIEDEIAGIESGLLSNIERVAVKIYFGN